jgi:Saxitoxin biosynthesis operon protein SxtJ
MKIDTSDKKVRNFGFLFSIVAIALAAFRYYRGGNSWFWFVGGSVVFLLAGLFLKPVLRPVYVVWMKFAFILGWLNTRLLLGVFFYLVVSPVGVVMRLVGRDPLTRKIDRSRSSYWMKREPRPFDAKRYEHLF